MFQFDRLTVRQMLIAPILTSVFVDNVNKPVALIGAALMRSVYLADTEQYARVPPSTLEIHLSSAHWVSFM